MKKRLVMLLVGGLLAVQLTACSGSESKEAPVEEVVTSETPTEDTEVQDLENVGGSGDAEMLTHVPLDADTYTEDELYAVPTEIYSEEDMEVEDMEVVTPTVTVAPIKLQLHLQ